MGRILLWVAALIIGVAVLAALVVWLAPLIASVIVLYIAGKIVCSRARAEIRHNNSIRRVDA